ncbi:MAG TPA: EamA/RhaT family transporter, partial [Verrucomicrobiae bacterium]|nr:EamA/RhaT family transporter [Verrucomicrobiae bacterium]
MFQIIFVSNLFTLIPVALLIRHEGGLHKLKPRHPWLVGLRSILLAIDMVLVFYAFVELPLADAYALIFAVP